MRTSEKLVGPRCMRWLSFGRRMHCSHSYRNKLILAFTAYSTTDSLSSKVEMLDAVKPDIGSSLSVRLAQLLPTRKAVSLRYQSRHITPIHTAYPAEEVAHHPACSPFAHGSESHRRTFRHPCLTWKLVIWGTNRRGQRQRNILLSSQSLMTFSRL